MASPPTCVDCTEVCIRPIDLDCDKHYICRECNKKRRGDLSCKLCGQQDQEEEMVFVYMDNSNTWIEAKKLLGSKGQEDHRVRIDVGELLKVVARGRHVAEANLYGSEPPPLDTVWEKMREKGWKVKRHKRSRITDKEKQVDTQLVTDATRMACKTKPSNNTIIFISGDADMKPAIEAIMEEGWKVEVFMWNHALSNELKKLDHKDHCTVCPLDRYKDQITYNSMRFPIANNKGLLTTVRAKGIVCKMKANCFKGHVPTDHWCKTVSEVLGLQFHYFWMEELNEKTKKCVNNSLVLVFTTVTASSSHIAKILEIHKTCPIKYVLEIKTYLQYEQDQSDNTSNFFYQMGNYPLILLSEESDNIFGFNEDENLSEEEYFSVVSESEKRDLDLDSCLSDHDTDVDNDGQPGEWRYVKSKRKKKKQLYSQQCQDGIRCRKGSSCSYKHTEEERAFFKTNDGRGMNWKTELCRYYPKCKKSSNQCHFAHGEGDAFCKACKKPGHLTTNCTGK